MSWWGFPQNADTFDAIARAALNVLGRSGHGDGRRELPMSAERVEQLMEAYRAALPWPIAPGRYTRASRRAEGPAMDVYGAAAELFANDGRDAGEWIAGSEPGQPAEWRSFVLPGDLELAPKAEGEAALRPRIGRWRLGETEAPEPPEEGERGN